MAASLILTSRTDIPAGDYVSEGLSVVMPDACFPNMVVGDKANHPWPYLRREVRHNWYCDRRAPQVGFLNRDEATLLYNLALPFRGKPALEVGSWMGWSTCHLALAGLVLDVIDPVLANPEHATSVRDSLAAAGVLSNVRLYATASPDGIRDLAKLTAIKWNFFFIDGDHEAPSPARDARE
jgi:predicted O-methyltransferase YrrM